MERCIGKYQGHAEQASGKDARHGQAIGGDLRLVVGKACAVASRTLVIEHPEGEIQFNETVDAPQITLATR